MTTSRPSWSPVNEKYYQDDSSDDDDDDQDDYPGELAVPEIVHLPLTPPPSHPAVDIPIVVGDQSSSPEVSPQDMGTYLLRV